MYVIIGLLAPTGRVIVPKGTTVEIVTEAGSIERRPWQTWDQLVLPGMTPGENRWIGVTLPVGTVASGVDLAELKGDSPLNGFALVVSPAPVTEVITSTLAWHDTILTRLRDGFDVGPQGGGTQEPGGKHHEGLDFHERVHVAAEHVTIQVEVRVTGADRVETEPPEPPGSQAGYACFVRSQVAVLTECLGQLGGTDPFEIAAAIAALSAAPTGDVTALLTAHATVLAKFDAFLTMLQKAQGDRADILQMVRWHDGLCGSPVLAALPQTAAIQAQLGAFVQSVTDRTMTVAGYLALLVALAPALTQTGTDLGQSALLGPGHGDGGRNQRQSGRRRASELPARPAVIAVSRQFTGSAGPRITRYWRCPGRLVSRVAAFRDPVTMRRGLPLAAVNQFTEGFPLAGPRGRDRVAARIGVADGDSPDGHPLGRHPVLRAEAGQSARVEAEERGAEAFIGHGEQDEQRGEPGVDIPVRDRVA